MIKIGLLAPFEGLHRRNGYAALTAMRQAIADTAPPAVAMMPLVLDDAADPVQVQRAVHKLLQDGAVRALVGPYSPLLAQQIQPLVASTGLSWWLPFAIHPTAGFVAPERTGEWAMPLLAAAAEQAVGLDCQRLVLAGWTPGWPQVAAAQSDFAIPVLMSDQVAAVQPDDAVLWLGSPEAGAVYLADLRAQDPTVPFFLGPQADDPILSEHTQINGPVYLLFWLDDRYEQWHTQYGEQSPTAYLTYRATQQAIADILGQPWPQSQSWRVRAVAVAKGSAP